VLFNEEQVLKQSEILRGVYDVSEDTPEILAFKSSEYEKIKQGVLGSLPAEDIKVLTDYSHLPMMFLRCKSLSSLNQLLNNPDVVRVTRIRHIATFWRRAFP
jgi:hypothetical protein